MVFMIGNYARQTIMKKNQEFALLLAENLNHQIYQRFVLPTALSFGRIELKKPTQYERLDQVVQSTIHGFKVLNVRIYDLKNEVSYATQKDIIDKKGLAGQAVKEAKEGQMNFELVKRKGIKWSFLEFHFPSQSYVIRTTCPLRVEQSLNPESQGPIIGVLQFSQDITSDYKTVIYFQGVVAIIILVSSFILFFILYMMIRRADKIIDERAQEKERLERQLHQNEKLASMGRMLSSIAHEIKNPLGIIQSSSEFLYKRSLDQENTINRLSKAIYEEATRLSRIVNDFLDYARPKQPQLNDVDLVEILKQVVNFLSTEIERQSIEIEWEVPEKIDIKGDHDHLYRAFYNIVSNAFQAVDGSGKINIRWENDRSELLIRDNGPGFDQELLVKYLEPFYTTKDTGTGLGLAIVNNILKNHGADIILENSPEGGAVVRIHFGA